MQRAQIDDPQIDDAPVSAGTLSRRYLWGMVLAIFVAALVALIEIDAQSGQLVDSQGRAWPFTVLVGFDREERVAGWPEVINTGLISDSLYRTIFGWHLVADFVLLAAWCLLLLGLARAIFRGPSARRFVAAIVALAASCDLVENVVIICVLASRSSSGQLLGLLSAATTAKWALLLISVAAIGLRVVVRQDPVRASDPRPTVRRFTKALMHHRFSVALVAPLIVLTVLSGSAILEQLPDVQRRWASDGAVGVFQAGCAIVALLAVAVFLEVLARFRTGWARRHRIDESKLTAAATPAAVPVPAATPTAGSEQAEHTPVTTPAEEDWFGPLVGRLWSDLRAIGSAAVEVFTNRAGLRRRLGQHSDDGALLSVWALGAVLPMIAAAVAAVTIDAPVLPRLWAFCAVPAAVVIISWVLRRAWELRPSWNVPDDPPRFSRAEVSTIEFTGRALALVAITIGGLGLIRSYVSVAMLGPSITGVATLPAAVFLIIGVVAVALPWLANWAIASGTTRPMRDPLQAVGREAATRLRGRWILLAVVLVVFVAVAVAPGAVGLAGVSAAAILCLSSLIGIPAAAGLLIQERPTAEVFRIIGLRRTPLVSVFVIAVCFAGLLAGSSSIHAVTDQPTDLPATGTAAIRPPVTAMVQDWLRQPGCEVRVGGQAVRPMIMVAAEGGGIRAAYWTVKGLAALQDNTVGGCGAQSTLFSGGASGGSVGLTVARFSGTPTDPGGDRAVASVAAMAEPATLAQAVDGTFVRDIAYGSTGVPMGTSGVVPPRSWADRARLIELGWNSSYAGQPWGTKPFLTDAASLSPVTGPLVVNSSSVASGCRAWLSQVDLEQPAPSDGEQQCNREIGPGARTVDLFSAYGPMGGAGAGCLRQIEASTGALLTARFPYVTPGGVIGPCNIPGTADTDFWPRTQLIDGGYIENTGLATITDLSAQWLAQVRSHNDAVVAAGNPDDPLIVPFVVFLTNEQATVGRLTEPPKLENELFLPAVGYLRGKATLTETDALLQRAATTVRTRSICPPPSPGTIDCDAVSDAFPHRIIVVDRTAQPEVSAPLGWVLSRASITSLDTAMQHQIQTTCAKAPNEPTCLRGYGSLGDLLGYLSVG